MVEKIKEFAKSGRWNQTFVLFSFLYTPPNDMKCTSAISFGMRNVNCQWPLIGVRYEIDMLWTLGELMYKMLTGDTNLCIG